MVVGDWIMTIRDSEQASSDQEGRLLNHHFFFEKEAIMSAWGSDQVATFPGRGFWVKLQILRPKIPPPLEKR